MSRILTSRFIATVANLSQRPKRVLPEVAFAGRSNVGKSSLLNALVGMRNLARVSSTPGKTRTLNYYLVESHDFTAYFVDLPGFGYAKVAKPIRERWGRLIEEYIETCEQLRAVVHIIDARHEPQDSDVQLAEWLDSIGRPSIRVLTKCDKVTRTMISESQRTSRRVLRMKDSDPLVVFSAQSGTGKRELWHAIRQAVERT